MEPIKNSTRFFGLDLHRLQIDWGIALKEIVNWPVLRWLTPSYATRVRVNSIETIDYIEATGRVIPKHQLGKNAKFHGYLLPDQIVLWHSKLLPKLSADVTFAAIQLEVMSLSPFVVDDTVWSFTQPLSTALGNQTHIVIASRKIIGRYIDSLHTNQADLGAFEVWVKPPQGQGFLVLAGFGEKKRKQVARHWRIVNLCLIFLLAALVLAAAVTPTVQLRQRALQAAQDYERVRSLAAPAIAQRELLVQIDQQVKALETQQEKSLRPELVLLRVTNMLPDDTYLTNLQVQESKVVLTGQTSNTAALMQQLGAQAGVKDVRAPTAAVKLRGTERETFYIEFSLDPSDMKTAQ